MSKIRNLPEATTVAADDLLYLVDTSVGSNGGKKVKFSTLVSSATVELDASAIAYATNDLLKIDIQTSSDDVEAALNDIDQRKLSTLGNNAMLADLDMGTNDITNAGAFNGVTITLHGSRHNPTGADPLATAAPVASDADGNNNVGTANAYAHADHKHNITTAAPISQTPNQSNTSGSSSAVSRADHLHNIPTATAIGLDANSTNTQGAAATFSSSNHTHAIATGTVSTQTPDQANAAGSSANLAKADHVHNIPTAAAVNTGTANSAGVAASFAHSDHVHNTIIARNEDSSAVDDTTASLTDVLIVGMTETPTAGVYLAMFSTSTVNSGNGAERNYFSLYMGGVQVSGTERTIGISGAAYSDVTTCAIVTVNGSQAIEARWRVLGGTGTVRSRKLILIRLGS